MFAGSAALKSDSFCLVLSALLLVGKLSFNLYFDRGDRVGGGVFRFFAVIFSIKFSKCLTFGFGD